MKYDGSSWNLVGARAFTSGQVWYQQILVSGGQPVVGFSNVANGNKLSVMKFDGSGWNFVGDESVSPDQIVNLCMALDGDSIYAAFGDLMLCDKLTVMKYDGVSWSLMEHALSRIKTSTSFPSTSKAAHPTWPSRTFHTPSKPS